MQEIISALGMPWNQAMCCPFWSWALLKACLVFSMRLGRFGYGMVLWTTPQKIPEGRMTWLSCPPDEHGRAPPQLLMLPKLPTPPSSTPSMRLGRWGWKWDLLFPWKDWKQNEANTLAVGFNDPNLEVLGDLYKRNISLRCCCWADPNGQRQTSSTRVCPFSSFGILRLPSHNTIKAA